MIQFYNIFLLKWAPDKLNTMIHLFLRTKQNTITNWNALVYFINWSYYSMRISEYKKKKENTLQKPCSGLVLFTLLT